MITSEIIEEVKQRLIKTYDPITIYIFGSYAWGHPDEESDLDILVVIDRSNEKRHKRSIPGLEVLWGLDIAKDLMIYTKEEFEAKTSDGNTLLYKIKQQGKILYARA